MKPKSVSPPIDTIQAAASSGYIRIPKKNLRSLQLEGFGGTIGQLDSSPHALLPFLRISGRSKSMSGAKKSMSTMLASAWSNPPICITFTVGAVGTRRVFKSCVASCKSSTVFPPLKPLSLPPPRPPSLSALVVELAWCHSHTCLRG